MPFIDKTKNLQSAELTNSPLTRIQSYIKNQVKLGRKFTIRDIADELNLSEYNMNKMLIKATGETLKSFIASCRRDFYENRQIDEKLDTGGGKKVGICLTCRKTGVDLLQLSSKRVRLQ
ncbi:hypothetical protein [Dyadobacter luticola]|uniref:HTH araC/xylS-type domain-containing protein n=1 Tax=Dyadobacter luticola TaxID=1979387 RepID=A0A5R9L2X2_9BACT|nr:hypothetical protein [Dyadobacter luticola]TLV02699.1 hypothetical protein FEN17_03510 [Dyadobacter luticola]